MTIIVKTDNGSVYSYLLESSNGNVPTALRYLATELERNAEFDMTAHLREIVKDEFTPCAETGKVSTRSKPKRKLLDRAESPNEKLQDSRV